jgi:serine/threonine-protein kinase
LDFLNGACARDEDLRREVESLLAADTPEDPLIQSVVNRAVQWAGAQPEHHDDLIGNRIGPYLITGLIGTGGMGEVYRAVRKDDFQMQVAIKLLKRGTDTDAALRRFRIERQILAGLQHPNIARLLDGGATDAGLPYFVMEYVEGVPLMEFAASLAMRQRLELFLPVCSAVEYAHRNRIVHRDIKPRNILVTAEGAPKLLDFGIAKLVDPSADGATTAVAGCGGHLMTPAYASPEQIRGQPVTSATDIFSLGVVLYELLTGGRSHRAEELCGWPTAAICINGPDKALDLARVDRNLANIIRMALREEPERRYATVEQFSQDIERYLQNRPVHARREALSYRCQKFLKGKRVAAIAAALSAVLGVSLVSGLHRIERDGAGGHGAATSIAVLPFSDVSPEKNQEYFCEGLTAELRNELANMPGMRVAGRVSSAQFKERRDYRVIGEKLHVAAILAGSVLKQGDRVRLTIELTTAPDAFHMWSRTFDLEASDIFTAQHEITREVWKALNLPLPGAKTLNLSAESKNADAHNAYLWGRYLLGRRNKESLEKAASHFEQATRLDPSYASAWAALGVCRRAMVSLGYVIPAEEGWRKARLALRRALELDPDLAEANVGTALIQLTHDYDWTGAGTSLHRALLSDPGNAQTIKSAAILATRLGNFDEAIALQHRAIEIEPLDADGYMSAATTLYYAGRREAAKRALEMVLELAPDIPNGHGLLGKIYLAESQPVKALVEIGKEKDPVQHWLGLALAYHALGRRKESDSNLTELIGKFEAIAAYQVSEVYAFRGEPDRALEWLERAYRQRDPGLTAIKVDPLLESLRRDPRYAGWLVKMRVPY